MTTATPPVALPELARASARIGADPLLIQAAGGNTSVKQGDTMWIKASGTLLADAMERDIFVPVDLPAMRASLAAGEDRADRPAEFTLGPATLRPSIETSLHAVFPQAVVIHVHCVNTIAHAIRTDARALLASRLAGFDWALVPYAKPGANLARSVRTARGAATDVVVLGNHGLIVAAETVAEADALLFRVATALTLAPAAPRRADLVALQAVAGADYEVPPMADALHQIALDPARLSQATGGSLYPDHVIFCGIGARALGPDETASGASEPFLLVPGKGALLRRDVSPGALALARCLADVLLRVPGDADLVYLTEAENMELLDWDAEKYRQRLNAGA